MMRLMSGDPQTLIRAGEIQMTGSPDAADQFRELLHLAKPDIETELGRILGQSAAHQLGSFARGLGDFGTRTGERLAQRMSEYLTVEKRSVLTHAELKHFLQAVDTLANDVERADRNLKILRASGARVALARPRAGLGCGWPGPPGAAAGVGRPASRRDRRRGGRAPRTPAAAR